MKLNQKMYLKACWGKLIEFPNLHSVYDGVFHLTMNYLDRADFSLYFY